MKPNDELIIKQNNFNFPLFIFFSNGPKAKKKRFD